MHATRSCPNTASSASVGGVAVRRHEALRQRDDSRAPRDSLALEFRYRLAEAARRNGEEDEIGAVKLVVAAAERADLQLARQSHVRQVPLVLAPLLERDSLLR